MLLSLLYVILTLTLLYCSYVPLFYNGQNVFTNDWAICVVVLL